MSYSDPATEAHTEQYKGHTVTIRAVPASYYEQDGETRISRRAHLDVQLDGRGYYGWHDFSDKPEAARIKGLVAKARKAVDRDEADAAILADVQRLIGRPGHELPFDQWVKVPATDVKVGDVAAVWGHGSWRRGIITKVAKTNATVAYTTTSNPDTVNRKADKDILVPVR